MTSASRCLVDAPVLAEAIRCRALGDMCRAHRIATGELVVASLGYQGTGMGSSWSVEVARLVVDGRIEIMSATATELAEVVRWVGSWATCGAELELLALALAGKGRVCTTDAVVRRTMKELGIEDRWVGVGDLLRGTGDLIMDRDGR